MKYYEITPDSPAYESLKLLWSYKDSWQKADDEIKNLIECDTDKNLYYNSTRLCLNSVPEHLTSQFCKEKWYNGNAYAAKKNSEIQKSFEKIIAKYGVFTASTTNVAIKLGTLLQTGKEAYYPPMGGKYYLHTERNVKELKGLVEIPETSFLRLYASWLDTNAAGGEHVTRKR